MTRWPSSSTTPMSTRNGLVVLHAMFDFAEGTDRAVILAGGELAVADGTMREVGTPPRS
jgi:hypothetical protein